MNRKGIFAIVLLTIVIGGCGPPSMGLDKDAFKAVDALYTAVSLRDLNLVGRCEGQLKALKDAGKLPNDAASALDAIIARGRKGEWEPAQLGLAQFMEGQRR